MYAHLWSVNTNNTHSPAGLIVVQVHKAATLIPGPSTVVLLPLSDVNKSLSKPATHIAPISLYISFRQNKSILWQCFRTRCCGQRKREATRDGENHTMTINFQVLTASFDYLTVFFWVSTSYDRCALRRFRGTIASIFRATGSSWGGCWSGWESGSGPVWFRHTPFSKYCHS